MAIPSGVGPLVQAVVDAAVAVFADSPADQVQACLVMATTPGSGPVAIRARRAAAISLARAIRLYQPSSRDDALELLDQVTPVFDLVVTEAGDLGDDGPFLALQALETAVVADLIARGASLAPLVTRTFGTNLPALVVAARLYGDATRADELVDRVDPVHPLFMPTSMLVLGS